MVENNSVELDAKKPEASGCRKSVGCGCLTLIILSILIFSWFVFQIREQTEEGKLWCETIIQEYENDKEKFLEKYSDDMKNGLLYIKPSKELKVVGGSFRLYDNGEFECRYSHRGVLFPHFYTYYSKTREWVHED